MLCSESVEVSMVANAIFKLFNNIVQYNNKSIENYRRINNGIRTKERIIREEGLYLN